MTHPSYRPSRRSRVPDLDALDVNALDIDVLDIDVLDPSAPSGLDQSPGGGHATGIHLDEHEQSAAGAPAASTSTGSQLLPLYTPCTSNTT